MSEYMLHFTIHVKAIPIVIHFLMKFLLDKRTFLQIKSHCIKSKK
jgi:hypothetical protein